MRVLLTSKTCAVGGIETFTVELAKALRAAGHTSEVFFFAHGPMAQYLPADCVAHFGELADCLRLVRARQFDIVHGGCYDWEVGLSAVRYLGAKLVITNHGGSSLAWTSANCDAFTGVSEWIATRQQKLTDLPVQVVLNGIDTQQFKPSINRVASGAPIVAWVGRGTAIEDKRLDLFAAVAPQLQHAGLRIWLAEPDGPDAVAKLAPTAVQKLRAVAEFWGAVSHAQMAEFYRTVAASGGCLVSTGMRESFSLAAAEAQACGCPVIGPNACGIKEVVRPEHGGVLYPSEIDPAALAELVINTVRDSECMRWRSAASAAYAREHFSLERMAEDYLRIYQSVLQRATQSFVQGNGRRLSPLRNWAEYINHCWSPGNYQYETSRQLTARNEWQLAAVAAQAAWATCPMLYARPRRLAHLLNTQLRVQANKYERAN